MDSPDTHLDLPALDACIERFEDAWNLANGKLPAIDQFVPEADHADYRPTVIELIRVDMERRLTTGHAKSLAQYLDEFPWVRTDPTWLGELAFEEYRLRLGEGDSVDTDHYASVYQVDTSAWPTTPQAHIKTDALGEWNASTIDILKQDTDRLVQSVANLPKAGDRFGDFTIIEELGEGKFAHVYLAQQGELANRRVALKISAELWSESDKLARLQHTNIVPIYSLHRVDQLQALCMPYLGRETLESVIPESSGDRPCQLSATDEKRLVTFTAKLAEALAHAHDRKIIHRDLKPANILLSEEAPDDAWEPLILDFNLSENLVVGGPTSLLVGGTLPYMAPEHLQAVVSRAKLTPACDLYSLGVILYQLTTGELPFPQRNGNFVESVAQMVNDRKIDTHWRERLCQTSSPDFASIVAKCMHPNADQRYRSAANLREDLLRHAGDQPLKHAANRSPRQRLEKAYRRHRHRLSVGTIAIAAGLLILVAGSLAAWQAGRASDMLAQRQADQFESDFDQLHLGLLMNEAPDLRNRATTESMQWIDRYGVLSDVKWRARSAYTRLPSNEQLALERRLGELLHVMSQSPATEDRDTLYAAAGSCLTSGFGLSSMGHGEWSVADLPPESTVGARLEITELIKAGAFTEAADQCRRALAANPAENTLWACKGLCEHAADDASQAVLSFTRCIALSPDDPQGYFVRGMVRLSNGEPEAAIQDMDRVLELWPGLPSAMLNRALALHQTGHNTESLEQLQAIPENPELTYRILMVKARVAEALGDSESWSRLTHRLLNETPADAIGWTHRGKLRAREDPQGAIEDFEWALRLTPNYERALQNLAATYDQVLKQPEQAHERLQAWITAYPRNPVPHASRAVLFARAGQLDEALGELAISQQLGEDAESLYYQASAYALASQKQPVLAAKAVESLRRCLNQDKEGRWFEQSIRDPDLVPLRENPHFGQLLSAHQLTSQGWQEK